MTQPTRLRRRLPCSMLVPMLCVCAAVGGAAGPAQRSAFGQQVMTFSTPGGPMGGGSPFRAPVTTRDVARFSQVLGLTPDQQDAINVMVESAVSEFNAAAKEAREKMAEMDAEFQDSRDPAIFRERMPEIMKKLSEKRSELEKALMSDLRLTLTPEQDASWERLERLRRREGYAAGFMGISGENVDLVKIGESVGLIDGPTYAGAPEQVRAIFEQYERELDAAIQARNRQMEESRGVRVGGPDAPPDRDAIAKAMDEAREKSVALRDINQKFARQIAGAIAEPQLSKWNDGVKRATFPDVYRETYTARAMKAALELADLSEDQRAQIMASRERYERELAQANEALARAIADADAAGARGALIGGSGGPTMIRLGEEPESVTSARTAKRDLEKKALDALHASLSESQRSKLPPRRPARSAGPGAEGAEEVDGAVMEVMEIRVGG